MKLVFPIKDTQLGEKYLNLMKEKYPPIKRWIKPLPTIHTEENSKLLSQKHDHPAHDGVTFTDWYPLYHSCVVIDGGMITLVQEGEEKKKVKIPAKLECRRDHNGFYLLDFKGRKYYPIAEDIVSGRFATIVRKGLKKC